MTLQRAAQQPLILQAQLPLHGGRAALAVSHNLQPRRLTFTEALHRQTKLSLFTFEIHHASDRVPPLRPQMQQAFSILARYGVLGRPEIEQSVALLQDAGVRSGS
jgi:hypothetical protein